MQVLTSLKNLVCLTGSTFSRLQSSSCRLCLNTYACLPKRKVILYKASIQNYTDINPFLGENISLINSVDKLDITIGLKGTLAPGLGF